MKPAVFNVIAVVLIILAGVLGYLYLSVRGKPLKQIFDNQLCFRFVLLMSIVTVFAVGLFFYGQYRMEHGGMEALKNAGVFIWLAMIAWIDWKERIIPNKLILAALIVWILMLGIEVLFTQVKIGQTLAFSLLGGGVCAGVMLLISLVVKDALGMGDVKMVFALGLFYGLMNTFAIILLSMIIMSITAVVLLVMKKVNRKTAIPMAPFVFFGLTLNLLLGM